jgi:hypothetical protein
MFHQININSFQFYICLFSKRLFFCGAPKLSIANQDVVKYFQQNIAIPANSLHMSHFSHSQMHFARVSCYPYILCFSSQPSSSTYNPSSRCAILLTHFVQSFTVSPFKTKSSTSPSEPPAPLVSHHFSSLLSTDYVAWLF